jgi:hypothetical protein
VTALLRPEHSLPELAPSGVHPTCQPRRRICAPCIGPPPDLRQERPDDEIPRGDAARRRRRREYDQQGGLSAMSPLAVVVPFTIFNEFRDRRRARERDTARPAVHADPPGASAAQSSPVSTPVSASETPVTERIPS